MASVFPGAIDSFTDPLSTSPLNSPSHAGQHQDLNDAVEKIETYMGLVKVIPTAVTGGTLSATGTITVGNAVSSVVISNAFSALYDNYKVLISGVDGSAVASLLVQFGGVTTGYYGSLYYDNFSGAATGTDRQNDAAWGRISITGTLDDTNSSFDVYSPFLTKRTAYSGTYYAHEYSGWFGGTLATTTSYTSMTILPSSGTLTGGNIRVYGYRN